MKAVIIDDEFWTRDSIRRLGDWARFGIDRVEEAEEGLSGLRIIEEIRPEIVITDMKMRGMDGVELLRRLAEDYPFIRKIVISGFDDFAYTKQAILSRVDEYILKPIHPDELNRALEKTVRELGIARGLHAAQPLSKEILEEVTACKAELSRHFQELQIEEVEARFGALAQVLASREPHEPGLSHSLYKQFMTLLGEQASKAGIELSPVIRGQAESFFVTDRTPDAEWIGALSAAYAAVMADLIQQRKNKNRLSIGDIRDYIDRAFAEPITLESIAARFFVSKEHLSRTFKQETGSTVMDYIIARRMAKAKELLTQGAASIKSAAEAVGYADPTYFHRIFKKVMGMTPAQARCHGPEED
ncbi:response regulator transcription factor [Cohnella nanjingensis]|uniref:Helix-turn-helix domain-containing protein n=1 Tax=Cohnella nanjingensis TaxID=1387779 RepID=A0A7X0RPY1_9BACL|nr:helix-turn-helix domain-containing protein [Cohnella nanjingensis]MBB6671547.1 helix-turn-helix domain-containing protein [Cohnella nanjingensis]